MPKTQKSELKSRIDRIISAVEKDDLNSFSKDDVQTFIDERLDLELEISDLRSRLEELEETLNAIRTGEVDALVISGPKGESIYSLTGAEHPYRIMVETMGEGAITINYDGTILFSNLSFARLAGLPLEKIVGTNFTQYIDPGFKSEIKSILATNKSARMEASLSNRDKSVTPIYLSISPLQEDETGFSVVVTDLTLQKNEELMKKTNFELEDKVRERTAELSKSNESLLAEIEERILTETKLRSAQKNLRAMVSEVILTEERSRQHFAADLHDSVVQTLAAAKLRSQLIQKDIPQKSRPIFADLQDLLSEGIIQARSIMSELSPPVLNELGLTQALEWLVEKIGEQKNINTKFENRVESVSLSREVEILLFQATRELLMNVVKHAQAQNAIVKFSANARNLSIEVVDDGKGFDIKQTFQPDMKGGFGLYGIRERLRHIGGVLAIKSKPGQGTTVLITASPDIEQK